MSFSTTSYFAGVGTVLAALTVGFSGALVLAPSTDHSEQNRLQRIRSSAPVSAAAPQTTGPEAHPRSIEITAASAPAPSAQQPARPEPIPIMAKAEEQAATPAVVKAADPIRLASQDATAKSKINTEKKRAAEAKAERKRVQRLAEQRKQREIELATAAVRRMPWDPGPQQFADRAQSPRFGFFGED